jgi:hypothetical protein
MVVLLFQILLFRTPSRVGEWQLESRRRDGLQALRGNVPSKTIQHFNWEESHLYARFHARREAWMLELQDNPSLFNEALDKAMETFDVRGFKEERSWENDDGYA